MYQVILLEMLTKWDNVTKICLQMLILFHKIRGGTANIGLWLHDNRHAIVENWPIIRKYQNDLILLQ